MGKPSVGVIGCGNIGLRHVRNLIALGASPTAIDTRPEALMAASALGAAVSKAADRATLRTFDAVIVATPTAGHVDPTCAALEENIAVFVEKPLAHTGEGVQLLDRLARERGVTTMVACNMRFHGGPQTVKRLIRTHSVGRVVSVLFDLGQYLPDWHPSQDYTKSYSARSSMGGGIILDAIHEVDIAIDWFGAPSDTFCFGGTRGDLAIDTEDVAEVLVRFETGEVVNLHMDYLQRTYSRKYKVIATEGTIEWSLPGPVRAFSAQGKSWEEHPVPADDLREMYVREMSHFLHCVERREQTVCPISAGALAARTALAAKASMVTGSIQRTTGEQ
ncbi:MAG: Gfo/Idh/MocA family protein [Thermoplasmatota archaeon]